MFVKSIKRAGVATGTALALGLPFLSGCGDGIDKVGASGEAIQKDINGRMHKGGKIAVAAAIISVAPGVNYRLTPVKIDTNNAQMVDGNKVSEHAAGLDAQTNTIESATILVRPVLIKNETRFTDQDPRCWLGGLQKNHMVWVGLNDETVKDVHIYERPSNSGDMPTFNQTITVTGVTAQNGIEFNAGGYGASAGLIRSSTGIDDPYLQALRQNGYEEVHPKISC